MTGLWMGLVGRESLIAADDMWGLLVVMTMGVFFSIWLEQKYEWASKVSATTSRFSCSSQKANRRY